MDVGPDPSPLHPAAPLRSWGAEAAPSADLLVVKLCGGSSDLVDAVATLAELNARTERELDRIAAAIRLDPASHPLASIRPVGRSWATYLDALEALVGDLVWLGGTRALPFPTSDPNDIDDDPFDEPSTAFVDEQADDVDAPEGLVIESTDALAGRRVLIVDPQIRPVFALASALERARVAVRYAWTGLEAVQSLLAAPDVDAVLLDAKAHAADACCTAAAIRAIPALHDVTIIALTGDRADVADECLAAGASRFVPGPADADEIVRVLGAWFAAPPAVAGSAP